LKTNLYPLSSESFSASEHSLTELRRHEKLYIGKKTHNSLKKNHIKTITYI